MQQLITVWQSLSPIRRVIVIGSTLAVFAAILGLSSLANKTTMSLLYAGLEGAQAAEVVSALEQRGAQYEVRGDSIFVEAPRRDELRMMLAGEGLPASGGTGYELLDSLSGFGTTSQMFDAAYWRAKEGELARTILANPKIRAARVHIANPSSQPFRKDLRPSASVWVTTQAGGISAAQAKSLKFLISSAVTGMVPDDVSVIDSEGGLVSSGEEAETIQGGESKAAEMKQNVERLLEARVGYGKSVVEISVETVTEREQITERKLDPDSRVAISTDTQESSDKSDNTNPGAVSVASNLPNGDTGNGGSSKSEASDVRERNNYEFSETKRELLKAPGAVKKLSVAVLVDGIEKTDDQGIVTWEARPQEELDALKELVASAVGFDETRGDIITLRSLEFKPVAALGTEVVAGEFSNMALDLTSVIQSAVLALVALILGLFVLKPALAANRAAVAELAAPQGASSAAIPALTGEIDDRGALPNGPMTVVSDFDMGGLDMPMGMAIGNFGLDEEEEQDPVERLKKLIEERRSESVEILRGWLEDHGEKA